MKKRNLIILTILVIIGIIACGYLMISPLFSSVHQVENDSQLIGGNRDSQGCLGPAGYSFNSSIGACVREWELNDGERQAAKIAIAPLSFPVTIIEIEKLNCTGCFNITLQRNDNQNIFNIELNNWTYAAPK